MKKVLVAVIFLSLILGSVTAPQNASGRAATRPNAT